MVQEVLMAYMKKLELGKHEKDDLETLSLREREIFQLLAEGKTIKNVAEILCLSPKTVESHKYNIMSKLNIDTITELIKLAIRKNVIPL